MKSSSRTATHSAWDLAYRRMRRNVDAVRRIAGRNASGQFFRILAGLKRVNLKTEQDVIPSEVTWTDPVQEVVEMPRPQCNGKLPDVIEMRIGHYTLRNCFLAVASRVRLIPPGPVPFQGNSLLAYALKPDHYRNSFVHVPLTALFRSLGSTHLKRGPTVQRACLLTNAWNRTYHHWVAELLPKITILRQAGVDCSGRAMKFIIPPAPTRWQLESLEIMGIAKSALITIDSPTIVEEFFVPAFPRRDVSTGGWSVLSPRILRQFRDGMHVQCGVDLSTKPSLKLYVSRRMALGRQVLNENELEQALVRLGFQIVVTENMSQAEEVRLFANARLIVGPSGSGLTNMVFCRDQAAVVEIAADSPTCRYPDSTDYSLTSGLGHKFAVYLAKPIPRLAPARFDLVVDVEDLCSFLRSNCMLNS